jgi:hypothetical protein
VTQQSSFFPLGGGMDLVTPAIALQPGLVTASLNYEPVQGGYRRRPKPRRRAPAGSAPTGHSVWDGQDRIGITAMTWNEQQRLERNG